MTELISLLERRRCREVFDERFTVERMVHDYLNVYRHIMNEPVSVAGQKARSLTLEKAS